jgi:hypothetical protein
MKQQFSGFYTPTKKEIKKSWSCKKTLFVFDTNVLLNLYRYTETTRDDFFQIINHISDKIWMPYHVGLEYQKNRLTVIKNEKAIFKNLQDYIDVIEKTLDTSKLQEMKLKQRLPELDIKIKEMQENITELLDLQRKEIASWNAKQPDVRSTDNIRKRIDEVFDKKIGSAPENQDWLNSLYKEGEQRYKLSVPPGYMDKLEKENKENFMYAGLEYIPMYGDLIIWKQVIEKVKSIDIDSLIFVTDDVKEDWWYILNSNGKKEIGARAELRDEIYKDTNVSSFELLRTTDFLKNGKEILEPTVKETSITEAKNTFENMRKIYTIHMDENILKKIKELSIDSPKSINELINESLSENIKKLSETNNKIEPSRLSKYIQIVKESERKNKDLNYKALLDKLDAVENITNEKKFRKSSKKDFLPDESDIEKILKILRKNEDN